LNLIVDEQSYLVAKWIQGIFLYKMEEVL